MIKCIFDVDGVLPSFYIEKNMTIVDQLNYVYTGHSPEDVILTKSPHILAQFRREEVRLRYKEQAGLQPVPFETYGASYEVICKQLFEINSLQPKVVVDKVREEIKKGNQEGFNFVDSMGDSMERAYLKRKLREG